MRLERFLDELISVAVALVTHDLLPLPIVLRWACDNPLP